MQPRSCHRVPVGYPADIQSDSGSGEGTLLDLSPTGCKILTNVPLIAGAYLALQIGLAHETRPLGVEVSVVRWSKGGQLGIEFLRFDQGDRERVTKLLGTFPSEDPNSLRRNHSKPNLNTVSA